MYQRNTRNYITSLLVTHVRLSVQEWSLSTASAGNISTHTPSSVTDTHHYPQPTHNPLLQLFPPSTRYLVHFTALTPPCQHLKHCYQYITQFGPSSHAYNSDNNITGVNIKHRRPQKVANIHDNTQEERVTGLKETP